MIETQLYGWLTGLFQCMTQNKENPFRPNILLNAQHHVNKFFLTRHLLRLVRLIRQYTRAGFKLLSNVVICSIYTWELSSPGVKPNCSALVHPDAFSHCRLSFFPRIMSSLSFERRLGAHSLIGGHAFLVRVFFSKRVGHSFHCAVDKIIHVAIYYRKQHCTI